MVVIVKLFGNLRERVALVDSGDRIRCDVKPGETVSGLLAQLNIPRSFEPVVIQNSQILKKSDVLINASEILIMQPLEGG